MEQKVTIYTLAEKLNMSVSAVSRAFNPNSKLSAEKRKIILEAAEQYGYVQNKMASRLSQQPIRIGVLMRGRIEAYYLKMLDGIKAAYADFQNYKVTCDIRTLSRDDFSADNACAVLEEFRSAGYDGVILHGIYHEGIVAKVKELAEADPASRFNLYINDYNAYLYPQMLLAQNVQNYTVTLLSDGTASYNDFNGAFNVENPSAVYESMREKFAAFREEVAGDERYPNDTYSIGTGELRAYCYVMAREY